jgi:hypothetical protein
MSFETALRRDPAAALPDELASDAAVRRDDAYRALLARLSHQSVVKHFDAYADVPWDDPDHALDPEDPRFELAPDDPLGATAWYRSLPAPVRARIGCHLIANFMRIGVDFESALKRGLLEFTSTLPQGAPEFRYCYHEIIEEAQHSLMFQEFVNRTGIEIPGLPRWMQAGARRVAGFGRRFPELFFLFVLGGEDPIDHVQRLALRDGGWRHPLVRRISQIHVTEEARHLSFARAFLRRRVPELPRRRLLLLRVRTPLLLGQMAGLMMQPSADMVRRYAIPREALDAAYRRNPEHRRRVVDALRKVRELCVELEIAAPPFDRLWRRMGIWEAAG